MTREARLSKLLEVLGNEADIAMAEISLVTVEKMVLSSINHETLPEQLDEAKP